MRGAFARALARIRRDAEIHGRVSVGDFAGARSIFPEFSVDAPMPPCKPPRGGPTETRPTCSGDCCDPSRLGQICHSSDCPWAKPQTANVSGIGERIDGTYRVAAADIYGRPTVLTRIPDAPPPFDPIKAWCEVGMAWMRCAYVTAEVPLQLALYHRVSVGL